MSVGIVLLCVAVVLLVSCTAYILSTMSRLNRLHIRTDSARVSLEGALSARAAVIAALQPELAPQVTATRNIVLGAQSLSARSEAENALLAAVRESTAENLAFIDAAVRVDLAARFYNDAVGATLVLRRQLLVRVLHLAGSAPLPGYYEALSSAWSQ